MIAKYKFSKFEFHAFQNFIWDLINRFQIGQIKFTPHQEINLFNDHQLTHIGPVYNLDNPGDFLYAWSRNKETVRIVTYDQFHKNGTPKIKVTFDLNAKNMTVENAEGIDTKSIKESFEKFFEFDSEDKNKIEVSDILPKEMTGVFLKNPPVQARDIVEKYYFGLHIRTSGIISGVEVKSEYISVNFEDGDGVLMTCNFFKPIGAEVARLNKGMEVLLVGEVFNVGENIVVLDNCRLLKQEKEKLENQTVVSPIYIKGNSNAVNVNSSDVKQQIKTTKKGDVSRKDNFWKNFIINVLIGGVIVAVIGGLILNWLTNNSVAK